MEKRVVFTICARNYLAQALTLKQTLLSQEEVNFYIFISDKPQQSEDDSVIYLSDIWIPEWESMAFKYNVTEFSTAIKPYCIQLLFKQGYEKVIYLDPDIYVVAPLKPIWETLDKYSLVLTPHFCDINITENIEYPEKEMLQDGICNLGFCAVKNDETGVTIVDWWEERLKNQSFISKSEGLFTDQKWMLYPIYFFPDRVKISHHMGLNAAVWNLSERELRIQDGKYMIRRKRDNKIYPLIFFHFSGYNPLSPSELTRRKPDINISSYPSFKPILEDYSDKIMKNGFENYSAQKYGFATYSNDIAITPLHRRLYRQGLEMGRSFENPFDVDGPFYKLLKGKRLIQKVKATAVAGYGKRKDFPAERKYVQPFLRLFQRVIGPKYYDLFVKLCAHIGQPEYNYFLIEKSKR